MNIKATARTLIAVITLAVVTIGTEQANAAPTECPAHFAGGQAPEFVNQKMAERARELCYSSYAVTHSGLTRTPLWSAEHLTRNGLAQTKGIERADSFHAEPRLPAAERAELRDYVRSGYDRGHLTPRSDPPTPEAQAETFTLANMIPQNPANNRKLWEGIENSVRTLAMREGELYVITGPLFQGANLKQLNGRVMVPTQIFKAVYDPNRKRAAAYLVDNTDTGSYKAISISELEQISGIDLFPEMPVTAKRNAMKLPKPTPHGNRREREKRTKAWSYQVGDDFPFLRDLVK